MAQHISIRVTWSDNKWNGKVCKNPCNNTSCLALKNIQKNKNEEEEEKYANAEIDKIDYELPCLDEGISFMSPTPLTRQTIHPYANGRNDTHNHFRPTTLEYPAYSLTAIPYFWLMKDEIKKKKEIYNVQYDEKNEPELKWKKQPMWVQDARNHRAIFDYFYKDVKKDKSLCLIYAKQVPFTDENKRVIIGIGTVKDIIPAKEHEYDHNSENQIRSMTWETMIKHSIRENCEEGFIFPYQEMMEYAENNPNFDMKDITVFEPEGARTEFSYATEHVSYDTVINVILQSIKSLNKIKECIPGPWENCIKWLNEKLNEVWNDRGAFPGLGAMLCAMKFKYGVVIAKEIKEIFENQELEYWDLVEETIKNPSKYLSQEIAESITDTNKEIYLSLKGERKKLFQLLSRISFSIEQANMIFNEEEREKSEVDCTDLQIIENPYILYEKTRKLEEKNRISIHNIDLAVFPKIEIRNKYPLEEPTLVKFDDDKRRIRAIIVDQLEKNAANGSTIMPINQLILEINNMPMEHKIEINKDTIIGIQEFLKDEVIIKESQVKDGKKEQYCKLKYYEEIDELIYNQIIKRINSSKRHEINIDWRQRLDENLNKKFGAPKDENEEKARQEKAAILKMLAEARLSVLVGGAGTGKTTVLSTLCSQEEINQNGILLLAPTGKARVRMKEIVENANSNIQACTIAQFLLPSKRYDHKTGIYKLSNIPQEGVPETVIIDESSMLTEDMFAALIQATKNAKRIIFVGDPNQLPPIGAGRPFVDLVRFLNKDINENTFPCVSKSYGKLKITRRQKEENRLDVELSKWYMQDSKNLDDTVFERIQKNNEKYIKFKKWETPEQLEQLILETIVEETEMENIDDAHGFNMSLGAVETETNEYFNLRSGKQSNIENWQILAPVRNMPHGVLNINNLIHNKYRKENIKFIETRAQRSSELIKPLGQEKIVYGDKVINVTNNRRNGWPEGGLNYVANGEIGIAGNISQKNYLNVEFSTQPGYIYSYTSKDEAEEKELPLELAYALTVHKSQGSQFKKVILVISKQCRLISREMIYTALTRQTEKLIILYDENAIKLRDYTFSNNSEIAKRFTDLFNEPEIVSVSDKYFEGGLIHKTAKGELVRSKSEVIIADRLQANQIEYEYEKILEINGIIKLPDFTITDEASGEKYYWEHCGRTNDKSYMKKWEAKKEFYRQNGIIEGENLIVTYDDENGGISSQRIQEIIDKIF